MHGPVHPGEALDVLESLLVGHAGLGQDAALFPFVVLPVALAPPQERVGPEEDEGEYQEPGHEDEGPEQGRVVVPVVVVRVCLVVHESLVESRVAAAAVGHQVVRVDGGARVGLGQDVVGLVAVGTAGHQRGEPDALDLAVVGLLVVLHHLVREVVPLHHRRIVVAGDALVVVEHAGLFGVCRKRGVEHAGVVEAVAVSAGRGVVVALEHGLGVSRGDVLVIAVALGAHLDGADLDVLGGCRARVHVPVAVHAAEVLLEVVKVFPILLGYSGVALSAGNRCRPQVASHVGVQIRYVTVAAQAAVLRVHRGIEAGGVHGPVVAVLAGSRRGEDGNHAQDPRHEECAKECREMVSPHFTCLVPSENEFHAAMPPKSRVTLNPLRAR